MALELAPGEWAEWYRAPAGAVAIVVAAFNCPGGGSRLSYDTPGS